MIHPTITNGFKGDAQFRLQFATYQSLDHSFQFTSDWVFSAITFKRPMLLYEGNLQFHLNQPEYIPLELKDLQSDLVATPTLQAYMVETVWCFRSGLHDFLLLRLTHGRTNSSDHLGKRIWMRMDRGPKRAEGGLLLSSLPASARDTYAINYNREVLTKGENTAFKHLGELDEMSNLTIQHTAVLVKVVLGVSKKWELFGTNCRWFCAVILEAFEKHFKGKWIPAEPDPGLLQFRGKKSVPAQRVRDLYSPTYQHGSEVTGKFSGIEALATSMQVLFAVGNTQSGLSTQSDANTQTESAMKLVEDHAEEFQEALSQVLNLASTKLMQVVEKLLEGSGDPEEFIMMLQLFESPYDTWSCFCYKIKLLELEQSITLRRVIDCLRKWIELCRLPSSILFEVNQLAKHLLTRDNCKSECDNLLRVLGSTMMFGLRTTSGVQEHTVYIFDISAEVVASVLGHMETEIRAKYLKAEVISIAAQQVINHTRSNGAQERNIPPFHQMLRDWVLSYVLFNKNDQQNTTNRMQRVEAINFFIEVAKECHKQDNYSSTESIMSALYELKIQEFKLSSQRIKNIKAVKKLRMRSHLQPKRTSWKDKVHESLPSLQVKLYPLWVDQSHVHPLSGNIRSRVNVCRNMAQIDWSAYRDCIKQLRPSSIPGGDKLVAKPIEDGLQMCATRIWLSIEGCNEGSRSEKYPAIIAKLKNQEVVEREKIRAGFIC